MTHITDNLHHISSAESTPKWTGRIASWFRAQKEKHANKQTILHLLSYNDRLLRDMGLTRAELIEELGYDPDWSRDLFRAANYHLPHL